MNKRLLIAVVMATLLVTVGAMAQSGGKGKPRVMINGKVDANLSRSAVTRGGKVMVPDQPFFKAVGSSVQRQQGWVRPGSQQPAQDRTQQWNVTQRNGRELRYRAGDRMYYYGGTPHYWSVAPYASGGVLYLSIGDLAVTLGGGYNYDPRYNSGQITLCEGGYCPAPRELRLTYPGANAFVSRQSQVVVQGYAPAGALVRVQVLQQMPSPFANHTVFSQTVRTTRKGLFSVTVYLPYNGDYRATVDLLDDYSNVVTETTHRFTVR